MRFSVIGVLLVNDIYLMGYLIEQGEQSLLLGIGHGILEVSV